MNRLKRERAEWDSLIDSTTSVPEPSKPEGSDESGNLSPLNTSLLDSPQKRILEQLQAPTTQVSTSPSAIQQRLQNIATNLEFTVDQFAQGVHLLSTTQQTADRLASASLSEAADVLEERERELKGGGKGAVDPMEALRGLARVLNRR